MIRDLFRACLRGRCDEPCPAVQKAIDDVAAEEGMDRARLLAWLERAEPSEFHDALLVAWGRAPLKLATGKTRDEWLALSDDEYRARVLTRLAGA